MLRNEQRLGSRVIERAAAQLAASFNSERISAALAYADRPSDAGRRCRSAWQPRRTGPREILPTCHLPHLPTRAEISARARAMFARTPSLDDIVDRAYALVLEAIGTRLRTIPV